MASLLNMSGGSLLNKRLPYDAEIEYLESTGTQYIDTGIQNYWLESLDVSMAFSITSFNLPSGGSYKEYALFGAKTKADTSCPTIFGPITTTETSQISRWCGSSTGLFIDNITTNLYYNLQVVYQAVGLGTVTLNGVTKNGGTNNNSNKKIGNMCFFSDGIANISYCKAKIYACSIKKDDTLVFDAIPVRIGQIGYMYDKVSGQLFGNAGTGDFILGSDKH